MPGRVDAIGVLPGPGTDSAGLRDRVRAAVGDRANVVTGAGRGEVEHIESIEAKEAVIAIGGSFGGLALLIAMFVVASTIGLSVLQREREVALLRAVAATPRQVRRMIAWEALLVGLLAAAVGILPGAWLARALGGALSDRGIGPEDMQVTVGVVPVLVAVAGAVLTAMLAVLAAGRRAARVEPTRALQESSAEPRLLGVVRLLGGLLAVGGGVALIAVAASASDPDVVSGAALGTSVSLVLAVSFLGPVVARLVAMPTGAILRRTGRVSGSLAASNVRTSPRRFASAMTPLVLTVALSCTMLFLSTTREHATGVQADERVTADLVLGSDGVGVPYDAVDAARRVTRRGDRRRDRAHDARPGPRLDLPDREGRGRRPARRRPRARPRRPPRPPRGPARPRHDRARADPRRLRARPCRLAGHRGAGRQRAPPRPGRRDLPPWPGLRRGVLPTAMADGHRTSPLAASVLIRTAPGARPPSWPTGCERWRPAIPG